MASSGSKVIELIRMIQNGSQMDENISRLIKMDQNLLK